jgi:hypothetical protein
MKVISSLKFRSPYLSIEDAQKLDEVREALRRGDLKTAAKLGRIFA